MTYLAQYLAVMKCRTPEDASLWLSREVERYGRDYRRAPAQARQRILSNVLYHASQFGAEARLMELLGRQIDEAFGDGGNKRTGGAVFKGKEK